MRLHEISSSAKSGIKSLLTEDSPPNVIWNACLKTGADGTGDNLAKGNEKGVDTDTTPSNSGRGELGNVERSNNSGASNANTKDQSTDDYLGNRIARCNDDRACSEASYISRRIRGFDKGDTYAMSEMTIAHLRPNLSAMVPRIEAPKIAPIVVPAVIISLSVAERV